MRIGGDRLTVVVKLYTFSTLFCAKIVKMSLKFIVTILAYVQKIIRVESNLHVVDVVRCKLIAVMNDITDIDPAYFAHAAVYAAPLTDVAVARGFPSSRIIERLSPLPSHQNG